MASQWGNNSLAPGASAGWFFARARATGFLPVLQVMPLTPSYTDSRWNVAGDGYPSQNELGVSTVWSQLSNDERTVYWLLVVTNKSNNIVEYAFLESDLYGVRETLRGCRRIVRPPLAPGRAGLAFRFSPHPFPNRCETQKRNQNKEPIMKTSILHDEQGQILAVSRPVELKAAGSKFTSFGMVAGEGQHLADVELSEEDSRLPLGELHTRYRIDTGSSRLVRK